VTVTIPSTTPLGTYRVLACADDLAAVAESNEANNCLASAGTVLIGRADLVVTSISSTTSAAKPGGTLSVTAAVSNLGTIASKAATTRYYLSLDSQKGPGDVVLSGTSAVPALAAGATSTRTVIVAVPTSTALGSYVLIACADDPSVVAEISEANNCTAAPVRIAISRADLVVSAVGNPPAGAKPGATFSVSDTVSNQGDVAAEPSRTRYYLSADQQRDAADRLLSATRLIPALSPGAISTGTVTLAIPSATPAGSYYVVACADDMRAIVELDEGNNCRASATRVTVAP
jgi:subtilase family serine protease